MRRPRPTLGCTLALALGLAPVTPSRASAGPPGDPSLPMPPSSAPAPEADAEEPAEDAEEPAPAAEPAEEAPAEAAATPPAGASRLAVLPVVLVGAADESLAARIDGSLQRGLARGAFALVAAAEVARLAGAACDSPACLAALGKASGATFALRARVTVNDRDYVIRLELVAIRDGQVVATSEERCDLCGRGEVGTLVETQAALLRRKLEDLIQGPPVLVITSQPSGALVYIDEELVGQTPLERTSIPGQHIVRVVREGHIAEQRQVELSTGVRESISLPLRRSPRAIRGRGLGFVGLGLGLPAVAAGAVLLVLDGREIRSDCSADERNQDLDGRCRFIHNTDWSGAVALAAGAALIAIGATLLRVHRPVKPEQRVKIEAAGLGLRGRF